MTDGRKPMRAISIAFDVEALAVADKIAADEERSRSAVVRRAIHRYHDSREN